MFIAYNENGQIMGVGASAQAALADGVAPFCAPACQAMPCTETLAQQVAVFGPVEWIDRNGVADVTNASQTHAGQVHANRARSNPPPRPRACYFTDAFGQVCQMTGPESAYLDSDALTIAGMAAVEAVGMTASGGHFEVR